MLAWALALASVGADECACTITPVRSGAPSAALIVGDAIMDSFYPELDAILDDAPPAPEQCTAAEGRGELVTRRGALTATAKLQPCANDVLTCVDAALASFRNASSVKVVHFNWGWAALESGAVDLDAYEATMGELYAKLHGAFPDAVHIFATTTPIQGDASIRALNDRALAALPSDVVINDLHASIAAYCDKENHETCSLHEPAGPLTASGRCYAAVVSAARIARLIPGVSTEGMRHSTQEGDATRFRPWEKALLIQGLTVMALGLVLSSAFAYGWYAERSDAQTNSWQSSPDMPPPVEIGSVQLSALGTMAGTPPSTPPLRRPLHAPTTPVSATVL